MTIDVRIAGLPAEAQARIEALREGNLEYETGSCRRCEEEGFHIMLDIETLGLRPGAPVLSIAAVAFCPHTGGAQAALYDCIDPELAKAAADFVDPEVEAWWAEQDQEAAAEAFSGTRSPEEAVLELANFVSRFPNAKVWGNGATFDVSILEHWIRSVEGEAAIAWQFWNIRDVRTVKDLIPGLANRESFDRETMIPHHALHDAMFQVRYVSAVIVAIEALCFESHGPTVAAD